MGPDQKFDKDKKELTALIVSDSYEERSHITKILLEAGYRHFEQASEGTTAFGVLKVRPIDFIICQWDMPNMTGISLLKILSVDVDLFSIPFLMVTKDITKQKALEAGICGVAGILVQPVTKEDLDKKIKAVMQSPVSLKDKRFTLLYDEAKRLTEEEQYHQALIVYKKMLKIRETPEIYYNIGHIKIAQGKYDEAFKAFGKAILVANLQAQAHKQMGEIYLLKGEPGKAAKCFKDAEAKQFKRELDEESIEALEEAMSMKRSDLAGKADPNIFNSLGIIFRKKKNYKKAIRYYKQALKVAPENEMIHYNLGRAYLDDGQSSLAEELFNYALSLNPNFEKAKKKMAEIQKSKS